ncbi:MAG: GAF domain-containing protein, partial [Candidatus Binatia bacterium]|nr:GAF domain-containing protein [Candidatus Binatia bacterium]
LLTPENQTIACYTQTDPSLHERRLPLEADLLRDVVQTGWPVHVADLARPPFPAHLFRLLRDLGYASLLVIPLRAAHRVIGVLLTCWQAQPRDLSRRKEELLQRIADQTAQALVNIRLYAEQERHLRESEALRRVGQSIAATLDLQDILKLVTKESARLLGCEMATVVLCISDHEAEIAGAYGPATQWIGLRIPLADSLTGTVIRERRAIRQTDTSALDHPLLEKYRVLHEFPPRSFLAVPLWQEHTPLGALTVATTAYRTFSLDDEHILQTLADQAVHAIKNARLYTQLQDSLRREQEANRQKSAFFASVSHELRTPLNIIAGYIELVREGVIGKIDHEAAEVLGRARKAVDHLVTLINDLLDLARIERAEFHISTAPIALGEFFDELYNHWEKPIRDKGLAFHRTWDREMALLTILSDRGRLRQILDNLLSNALKFTTVGHIAVGTRVHDTHVDIWVQDTGPGIEPADQERIFDEFWQIEQKGTSHPNGVGLGLAVSRKLAQLLGGTLTVTSTPNCGSTFTLTLPLRPTAA